MYCKNCGAELKSELMACPFCGQAMSEEMNQNQQILYSGEALTKREFLNLPAMKTCKNNIYSCSIGLYVLGVINIGVQVFFKNLPISGIILILLGLWLQLGISRAGAITCTMFAILNSAVMYMNTGRPGGWLIIVIAIGALKSTYEYKKAWDQYKLDGSLPVGKQ